MEKTQCEHWSNNHHTNPQSNKQRAFSRFQVDDENIELLAQATIEPEMEKVTAIGLTRPKTDKRGKSTKQKAGDPIGVSYRQNE